MESLIGQLICSLVMAAFPLPLPSLGLLSPFFPSFVLDLYFALSAGRPPPPSFHRSF